VKNVSQSAFGGVDLPPISVRFRVRVRARVRVGVRVRVSRR